jgi:hypothetical protein
MSWKETLGQKLSAYAEAEFNYVETKDVADASKIDLGCSGIYMECTVIYFEIKNLAFVLKENGRRKMAQAYTMLKEVLTAVTKQDGAFVNCYAPNAFLVVYPGREDSLEPAVKGAMRIAHAVSEDFKHQFSGFMGLEFSMGLEHGHIMGTKNISDEGYEHISWFGNCINKSMSIAKECMRPFHVGIASSIYHNLSEEMRIVQRRVLGIKKSVEIWTKVSFQYDNVKKHLYQTNQKIPLEEA